MPVFFGSLNPSSLLADDVYVSVLPPQVVIGPNTAGLNGAVVGAAGWGPKNQPISCNTPSQLFASWGTPINSGFDIVQEGALFLSQLPQGGLIAVRVSDTTDVAATNTLADSAPATGLTITGKYTGSFGNQIKITLKPGSNSQSGTPTWMVIVAPGSQTPEVFDKIPQGGSGGQVWTNILNAINTGTAGINNGQPSQWVVATIASSTHPPTAASTQIVTLASGTDGAGLTTSQQIGVDGPSGSRTGMYALRGSGFDTLWLAGNSDSTGWSTVATFAQSESGIGIGSLPKNTSVAAAVTAKVTAGLSTPWFVLAKDWVTYLDTFLGFNVQVPPSSVIAGICSRRAPHQSPGNQPAYSLVGTEATLTPGSQPYGNVDIGTLEANGINLIALPIPSGNTFGLRHGKNTSGNFATSEIPYTRKTNDLIKAFAGPTLGQFVNALQSTAVNDPLREAVNSALNGYLGPQVTQGIINAYSVQCDLNNNTPTTIASGLLFATIIVQYLSVVDKFLLTVTAGQTVSVVSSNANSG